MTPAERAPVFTEFKEACRKHPVKGVFAAIPAALNAFLLAPVGAVIVGCIAGAHGNDPFKKGAKVYRAVAGLPAVAILNKEERAGVAYDFKKKVENKARGKAEKAEAKAKAKKRKNSKK